MTDTTTTDIAKIRKAYLRVQDAMARAKDAGDKELMAKYREDYFALKKLLADAKAEERDQIQGYRDMVQNLRDVVRELKADITDLTQELQEARKLQDVVKKLKTERAAMQMEIDTLKDEVRWLRAPAPVEDYRRSLVLPPQPTIPKLTAADIPDLIKEATGSYP